MNIDKKLAELGINLTKVNDIRVTVNSLDDVFPQIGFKLMPNEGRHNPMWQFVDNTIIIKRTDAILNSTLLVKLSREHTSGKLQNFSNVDIIRVDKQDIFYIIMQKYTTTVAKYFLELGHPTGQLNTDDEGRVKFRYVLWLQMLMLDYELMKHHNVYMGDRKMDNFAIDLQSNVKKLTYKLADNTVLSLDIGVPVATGTDYPIVHMIAVEDLDILDKQQEHLPWLNSKDMNCIFYNFYSLTPNVIYADKESSKRSSADELWLDVSLYNPSTDLTTPDGVHYGSVFTIKNTTPYGSVKFNSDYSDVTDFRSVAPLYLLLRNKSVEDRIKFLFAAFERYRERSDD